MRQPKTKMYFYGFYAMDQIKVRYSFEEDENGNRFFKLFENKSLKRVACIFIWPPLL